MRFNFFILLYTSSISSMKHHSAVTPLPPINRNTSIISGKAKIPKPLLYRIHFPPCQDHNTKENSQTIMLQSCITKDRYQDILDSKQELKIASGLQQSKEGTRKNIESNTNTTCIGKQAAIKYYHQYKSLDRTLLKRDLNNPSYNSEPNFDNPLVSLLQKADSLQVLPLCFGIVKSKGDASVLNVSDYNLGDKYVITLAAGLKKAKMLEKLYLSGNRITDISLCELANSINAETTVLELSRNKITALDKKLLEMIIQPQYRLQSLGVANNLLRESSADAIFRNARYSRHIKRLDLRNNKLGIACLDSLVDLLEKSTTLQQLYIGSNYLSGRSGQRVFNVLALNKTLQVFDYSLNHLGNDGGIEVAQAVATCLQSNQFLQHLDLSFNNFSKEASQIVANGLEPNKTLYGFHFRGNYGYINSRGFLIMAERQGTQLHSVDKFKMDAFQVTSSREQNSMGSYLYRDVCWVCEGWYEQQFKLSLPKQTQKILVYIHFDFQKYEPRLISLSEQVKYVTMVPPRKYRFFYTVNNEIIIDENCSKQILAIPETYIYQIDRVVHSFCVATVNYRTGKAKKIVDEWNGLIIKTVPRCNGLTIKKEKDPWGFGKSVWAKEYKLQNEQLLRKCFEKDWKCSKLTNLVKNQTDQDKVKELLWSAYVPIKNIYKQFSSWSPFGDVWAVSSQPFTQFCQQSRIISKDTPLKIIDLTFITTNSMSGIDWKGSSLVPERGLVRFQFMQSLVRLAEEKFKKLGLTQNFADSTNLMLKQHVLPLSKSYNPHEWRSQKYFNQFNDLLVKKYRGLFNAIYKRNSKLKVRPGEKPYMCLAEFRNVFQRAGLTTTLSERDTFLAFNNSMMTQIDQLQNEKFIRMTQIQFIEGVARCAYCLPSHCSLSQTQNPLLHLKLEWLVQQLRNICPQQIRNQFPQTEESMFLLQQQ